MGKKIFTIFCLSESMVHHDVKCIFLFCFQYLDFGGFDKTQQTFDKEISSKGKPLASIDGKGPSSQKQITAQVCASG